MSNDLDILTDQLDREEEAAASPLLDGHPDDAVEVRRDGLLCGLVGLGSAVVAVAYLLRAVGSGSWLDYALCLATAAVALPHVAALVDSRAPLMVLDRHGVRVRRGASWQGVAWPEVTRVDHHLRRSLLRDGALTVHDVDGRALGVRLSMSTRLHGVDWHQLTEALAELSGGLVEVTESGTERGDLSDDDALPEAGDDREPPAPVEEDPGPGAPADAAEPQDTEPQDAKRADTEPEYPESEYPESEFPESEFPESEFPEPEYPEPEYPDTRDSEQEHAGAGSAGVDPSRRFFPRLRRNRQAPEADEADAVEEPATAEPEPRRSLRLGRRAEVVRGQTLPAEPSAAGDSESDLVEDDPTPGLAGHGAPGRDDDETAQTTVIVSEAQADPTASSGPEPVVGPQLAAARQRLRLSVDQLAERTRIRPHVIEAIEADDFAPCGGDFYARGHLRTLARVLGTDAGPLLAEYDERYSDAPIDPRRVFEAELAAGGRGSIRSTRGGPRWSVLVAAVMAVVLVWSIARLVTDTPSPTPDRPVLNGSPGGRAALSGATQKVPVSLTAATGGAKVIVRDGRQRVVFDDELAFMQTAELEVVPPVRISSTDGGLEVSVDGEDLGALGATGKDAQRVFVP